MYSGVAPQLPLRHLLQASQGRQSSTYHVGRPAETPALPGDAAERAPQAHLAAQHGRALSAHLGQLLRAGRVPR